MIEFDYAFATDTPGGPKIFDDVCDRLNAWIDVCRCGKEKRWPERSCDADKIISIGWVLVEAELKCDQEPSTLDVANALIRPCQSTALIVIATPKKLEGAWGVESQRI